jgi:hypothetical protein
MEKEKKLAREIIRNRKMLNKFMRNLADKGVINHREILDEFDFTLQVEDYEVERFLQELED